MYKTNKTIKEPNIGIIRVNRINGDSHLVWSTIPSQTYIELSIHQGVVRQTDYDRESFYPSDKREEELVTIAMTPNQWGELASSFVVGLGVPCTIKSSGGEEVDQEYKTEPLDSYYENKFKSDTESFNKKIKDTFSEVKTILEDKKTISKGDRQKILSVYNDIMRFHRDELPFLEKLIAEDTEKQLSTAQSQFKANMEHLGSQQNLLSIE